PLSQFSAGLAPAAWLLDNASNAGLGSERSAPATLRDPLRGRASGVARAPPTRRFSGPRIAFPGAGCALAGSLDAPLCAPRCSPIRAAVLASARSHSLRSLLFVA